MFRLLLTLCAIVCFAPIAFAAGEIVKVDPFIGRWIVEQQILNEWEARSVYFRGNTVKGRIIKISKNSLTANIWGDFSPCEPLSVERNKTRAFDLMEDDAYKDEEGDRFSHYALSIKDNAKLDVFRFKCGNKYLNFGDTETGSWVIALNDDKLALRYFSNMILILKKIPEGKKVSPSFKCDGKLNATEKAICGSDELAGYDLNIAEAYQDAVEWYGIDSDDAVSCLQDLTRKQQRAWIKERNKCKDDAACIKKSVFDRLSALYDQRTLAPDCDETENAR